MRVYTVSSPKNYPFCSIVDFNSSHIFISILFLVAKCSLSVYDLIAALVELFSVLLLLNRPFIMTRGSYFLTNLDMC